VVTDIAVVDTLCPANRPSACKGKLACAEEAKDAKYKAEVAAIGAGKFFPLAMESTGGMHKGCALAVAEILKQSKHIGNWAPCEVVFGVKRAMAVAVQIGNAKLVLEGLSRSERDGMRFV